MKHKKKAVKKYNEKNYDEVKVRVKKGSKDIIQRHANSNNETVNGMINRLLENEIPELKDWYLFWLLIYVILNIQKGKAREAATLLNNV